MRRRERLEIVLALVGMLNMTGCEPVAGGGGGQPATPSCKFDRPSPPFVHDGPRRDGPNHYQFTVRAEGDVTCTGVVAKISVTVVLHHKTNGKSGAVTGRSNVCNNQRRCESEAEYRRQRLYCLEVYHYDDYTQVTGWYKVMDTGAQERMTTKESRNRTGSSYKPPEAGCKEE